jgi:hypothetical protein
MTASRIARSSAEQALAATCGAGSLSMADLVASDMWSGPECADSVADS